MNTTALKFVRTDSAPARPAQKIGEHKPELLVSPEHHFCPGCGEPIVMRLISEVLVELGLVKNTIAAWGVGCYTAFTRLADIEQVQAMHGRAPSLATGVKRMRPGTHVFTLQGDGDMVNEGLQEVIHAAARAENITCILLNNGVFGETGGHMTTTSVIGQRTKNTLEGRDAARHGNPIRISNLIAAVDGAAYVARGSVHDAAGIMATKKMIQRAFRLQTEGAGFSFVEVLTMCPTGWFVPVKDGPGYMQDTLGKVHSFGEIKAPAA
jgi:2-oxoglutarate ferredoxin oxidoreductase subunit beta